jgi:hypothetical protein
MAKPEVLCLVCERAVDPDSGSIQFNARGTFGSEVFDSTGHAVCAWLHDACFNARRRCLIGRTETISRETHWITVEAAIGEDE